MIAASVGLTVAVREAETVGDASDHVVLPPLTRNPNLDRSGGADAGLAPAALGFAS